MTEKEKVDRENVNSFPEIINGESITGDEAPGKVSLGRYLCTCVESQPINRSTGEGGYDYLVANLNRGSIRLMRFEVLKSQKINRMLIRGLYLMISG